MRILFDQGVPRGLTASLRDHEVTEARKLKWERVSNGELLKLAEGAGFDLLLTTDKNVRYQQNLADWKNLFRRSRKLTSAGLCGSVLTRLPPP
jgi:hypothetical protein